MAAAVPASPRDESDAVLRGLASSVWHPFCRPGRRTYLADLPQGPEPTRTRRREHPTPHSDVLVLSDRPSAVPDLAQGPRSHPPLFGGSNWAPRRVQSFLPTWHKGPPAHPGSAAPGPGISHVWQQPGWSGLAAFARPGTVEAARETGSELCLPHTGPASALLSRVPSSLGQLCQALQSPAQPEGRGLRAALAGQGPQSCSPGQVTTVGSGGMRVLTGRTHICTKRKPLREPHELSRENPKLTQTTELCAVSGASLPRPCLLTRSWKTHQGFGAQGPAAERSPPGFRAESSKLSWGVPSEAGRAPHFLSRPPLKRPKLSPPFLRPILVSGTGVGSMAQDTGALRPVQRQEVESRFGGGWITRLAGEEGLGEQSSSLKILLPAGTAQ